MIQTNSLYIDDFYKKDCSKKIDYTKSIDTELVLSIPTDNSKAKKIITINNTTYYKKLPK